MPLALRIKTPCTFICILLNFDPSFIHHAHKVHDIYLPLSPDLGSFINEFIYLYGITSVCFLRVFFNINAC